MQEVFHEAVAELEKGNPMVVATVVHTKGSTPQKPGAKLLVRDDGSGVGTLGGGCVEGDIWFAASQLLKRGGASQYRDYELNEDLAAQDGLVCGGTMYFVIDPIYSAEEYLTFAQEIDAAYSGGPSVALATLINPGEFSAMQTGAKLFIRENGTTEGTLGDSALDSDAIKNALDLMAMGRNKHVKTRDGAQYFIEGVHDPAAARSLRGRTRVEVHRAPGQDPRLQAVHHGRPRGICQRRALSAGGHHNSEEAGGTPFRSFRSTRTRSS